MGIFFLFLVFVMIFLMLNRTPEDTVLVKRTKRHKRNDSNRSRDNQFTKEDKEKIFRKFENRCFNCGSKKNLTIDHHYPLEKGYGLKNLDGSYNAVLLCAKCNMKKSNKMPEFFYEKDKLELLQKNYGLKKIEKEVYDIYKLRDAKSFVEFSYLGKIYKGTVEDILEENISLLGVKKKVYLEVIVDAEKIAFPLNGVKNIKKIETV